MKLIAETAWHHDGDFIFFKDLVTTIATKTDTDYIKLHLTLDLDSYMQSDHPAYGWAKSRVFSKSQWYEIISIIERNNKKAMMLFNDTEAIEFGMCFKPELVEIHSVCLNDILLLNCLKSKIDPTTKVVLGIGGSDIYEIENAISVLNTNNIVLMHGFQNYPTKYQDINFNKIRRLIQFFPCFLHGYADHTAMDNENNLLITLFGAACGVSFIEKHVTTQIDGKRTDWQAAITIDMFQELYSKLKVLNEANGDGLLKLNEGEKSYSTFGKMKKAAVALKDIYKNEILNVNDLFFIRTGQETDVSQIDVLEFIGKEVLIDLKQNQVITSEHLKRKK